MSERLIAIGDIHGCSLALRALIAEIGPGPTDVLITLGDYVDKGDDSKGVLDCLLELERRCQLVPLLGNHDSFMLAAAEGRLSSEAWMGIGGDLSLMSYGPDFHLDSIPQDHVDFLRRCKLWHETDTHFFVHASYEERWSLAQQEETTLLWQSIRSELPGPHCSGKTAVVGHTSQKDGEILDVGHLVCIDTYCHGGAWLTALEVRSGRVWQADQRGELR